MAAASGELTMGTIADFEATALKIYSGAAAE